MRWTDGDLLDEFDDRLDRLLTELAPSWQVPPVPEARPPDDEEFVRYQRRCLKRLHAGTALSEQPDAAQRLADQVLAAIVHDEDVSFNRQLIEPMVAAIGRRAVQEHLVATVHAGVLLQKVCAVRAWYWSQPTLVYRSGAALAAGDATSESRGAVEEVKRGNPKDRYRPHLHPHVGRARSIAGSDPQQFSELLHRTDDTSTPVAICAAERDRG